MGFFASTSSSAVALEGRWVRELSRFSDLIAVLPLFYSELQEIRDCQEQMNAFIEKNGTGGLGVIQYLNTRLEKLVSESIDGRSDGFEKFKSIVAELDGSTFLRVIEGGAGEPAISISTGQQFNKFLKNMTIANAELLVLDEPAIHHWRRTLQGAHIILREFCPDALKALRGRHLKIVPVMSSILNQSISASNEFVSAAITASWVKPKDCAEMLLHEMGHSLLADIMAVHDLWYDGEGELFYSPFRNDARPIDGLFHAAYSFHNVCVYKSRLANAAPGRLAIWSQKTLVSDFLRTLVCVNILEQSSMLTELGAGLLKTIKKDLTDITECIDLTNDVDAVPSLRKHFTEWSANHENVSTLSVEFFSQIIDKTLHESVCAEPSKVSLSGVPYDRSKENRSSTQFLEFDSTAEFWRVGFPSHVSVLRGKAPEIATSIAADIAKYKDLQVPVIEKDSYKGNSSDPRCIMTLSEAFNRDSGEYILVLRNYERISSCGIQLESFVADRGFTLGATEHLLFYNCAGVTVPFHTDSANNVHFVVSGKKTFFIAHPNRHILSDDGYQDGFSGFRPFLNIDAARQLGEFVTLLAGDVLFIPLDRWHAVYYHEASISLSIFDEIDSSFAVTNVF